MADDGLAGLIVKIGADIATLKSGMEEAAHHVKGFGDEADKTADKAEESLVGMAKTVVKGLVALGAAVIAVSGAIQAMNDLVEEAQAIEGLSKAFRVSIEDAGELAAAAKQCGVEIEVLTQAAQAFALRAASGLTNSTSDFSLTIRAMGISVRGASGEIRSLGDLLPEIAEKFATYRDDAQRTMLAVTLFGNRAGPQLAGLLAQGRDGLERLRAEAYRLGVLTSDQVESVNEYTKATAKANEAIARLSREFALRLLPIISAVTSKLADLLALLPSFSSAAATNAEQQAALTRQIEEQVLAITTLEGVITRMGARAREDDKARLERAKERLTQLQQQLDLLRQIAAAEAESPPGEGAPPSPTGRSAPNPDAIRKGFEAARFELELFLGRLSGTRTIIDEMNFQWMSHGDLIATITQKVNAAYADQTEAARRMTAIKAALAKQEQAAMLQTATMAANVITQLFPKSKAAGIAAAVINTAVGITNALSTGLPPWNLIQAGLVAASGAAQIATIRSTSATGGGSTPSVSGSGGGAGAGEGQTSSRMLSISGLAPESRYSGSSVLNLIDQISEEVRNGAVLISTSSTRQQPA